MASLDWPGLLRLALTPSRNGGLGLLPCEFWALSPVELRLMLGEHSGGTPGVSRGRLGDLMAAYPDKMAKGGEDGRA